MASKRSRSRCVMGPRSNAYMDFMLSKALSRGGRKIPSAVLIMTHGEGCSAMPREESRCTLCMTATSNAADTAAFNERFQICSFAYRSAPVVNTRHPNWKKPGPDRSPMVGRAPEGKGLKFTLRDHDG